MCNLIQKKNKNKEAKQSRPATPQTNRVDELVDALQREDRIKELEVELKKLDHSSLSPIEQESWWHLYGIAAFQEGRDPVALERFQKAHKKFPGSARIRFSLGQQYIRADAVEKGFVLFRSCEFPEVPREYALTQARYAYLWNRYSDGFLFLKPFYQFYQEVKILDDHFLYVRGLPFFGRWWSYLASIAILADELEKLESVTDFVVENCHEYDFVHLQLEYKAYRDDNPEILLDALNKQLSNMPEGNFPTGYKRMKIAVIKTRDTTDIESAHVVLTDVTLSEQDPPWLEDIRSLALAEAAHRLGDPALENECIKTFMMRQPILLEPDIALNFNLLRYQETLKPKVTSM